MWQNVKLCDKRRIQEKGEKKKREKIGETKRRRKIIPPSGNCGSRFLLKAPTMNEKDILVKCQNHKESESSKSFQETKQVS